MRDLCHCRCADGGRLCRGWREDVGMRARAVCALAQRQQTSRQPPGANGRHPACENVGSSVQDVVLPLIWWHAVHVGSGRAVGQPERVGCAWHASTTGSRRSLHVQAVRTLFAAATALLGCLRRAHALLGPAWHAAWHAPAAACVATPPQHSTCATSTRAGQPSGGQPQRNLLYRHLNLVQQHLVGPSDSSLLPPAL